MRSAATSARLPLPWRVVRAVATLAAFALLAAVLAHWVWRWFGPVSPVAPPPPVPDAPAAAISAVPWFGEPAAAGAAPAAPAAATDARLLGVIAGRDGSGYALFRLPDRGAVLVASGDALGPGVTVDAVSPDGVRLTENGATRNIALRPAAGAASMPPLSPTPAAVASARTGPACHPAGAGNTAPYRLNAELLAGIAAKPETWSNAFTVANDGISMREGNAFGTMLGMRPGDRVTQANGMPLRGAEDVLIGVIRPLLANQAVRVTGLRDGRIVEWVFVNAGACPP